MLTLEFNLKGYTELFTFENNLKIYLEKKMNLNYGCDWLKNHYPRDYSKCEFMKNQKIKYLSNSTQNISLVSFLYFKGIREIIETEWDKLFYIDFKNVNFNKDKCKQTVNLKLFEIEVLRNTLSHAQPISSANFNQLEVNINFFKSYIPDYKNDLFEDVSKLKDKALTEILEQIQSLVSTDKIVDMKLIASINDLELKSKLDTISTIPRTRDYKFSQNYCILKKNILEQINTLLGDDYV